MLWSKQSTALTAIVGPILDSTGAEYTSAVIGDLSLSKNGGTLTALASAATLTHIANGQYTLVLTTGNTDTLGRAQITCNKSTYQMPTLELMVLPATVFDALVTNATTAAGGLGDIQRMAGTALTGRDIGASVLLSSGTGTGQVKLSSGYVAPNWADVGSPTTTVDLSGTTIKTTQKVDVDTIKTNPVVNGGTITFPTNKTLADTTSAVGSVTGNVGGNVTGSVGSVASGGITAASIAADAITAAKIADGAIDAATFAAGAIDAAAIATDALGALELAAGAASEIATAVRTELTTELGRVDAAVSSRMATYTQPTGFLAATFPSAVGDATAANQSTLLGRLTAARAAMLDALSLRTGTAQAGAAGTITLDSGASATNDLYKGQWIAITSGTGASQTRLITAYVGSTKVATVHGNWATNPASDSVFYLLTAADIYGLVLADTVTTLTNAAPDEAGVTTLLARLTSARAGYLDNINNSALQTTAAQTGDVYPLVDTEVAAIKAKTDNLPASPAAVGSAMTLTSVYDPAKTAAQAGDAMTLTSGERTAVATATRDISNANPTPNSFGDNAKSASASAASILGKLTGITSLAQWLGLITGKQVGNTTARTELNATGAGSGTYDETEDSLEAQKDAGVSVTLDPGDITDIADAVVAAIDVPSSSEIANDLRASGTVELVSPVSEDGDETSITLNMRDDYTDENGQPLTLNLPTSWPVVTGLPLASIKLGFGPEFGGSGVVVIATEIVAPRQVKFEPTDDDTGGLVPDVEWKGTILVDYPDGGRRSQQLNLTVVRSYVP